MMELIELVEALFEREFVDSQEVREYGREELLAGDASILKSTPVIFGKRVDGRANHAANAGWHFQSEIGDRTGKSPTLVHFDDVSAVGEELQQAPGEQRKAVGFSLHHGRELWREVIR